MAWKVIGIIEGRNGAVTILPEWAIGRNDFNALSQATAVAEAMRVATSKFKPALTYAVVPTIDDSILAQVRGGVAPAPTPPNPPALSFGASDTQPPPA